MSKRPKRSHKQPDSNRRRPQPLFTERVERSASGAAANKGNAERAEYLTKLGLEAYQTRRLDDAATYLTNALALAPQNAVAHNCLGIVRRAQGDVIEAIACYERALRCESSYAEAHNNLGVAWEARGEYERAAAEYRAALKSRPQFAAAMNNLGNVLTKLGRPQEAVQQLRNALREQPGFAPAHNNLGLALTRLGQTDEAEQCFRRALDHQPRFAEANVNLGNVLRAKKQLEGAAECYRAAIGLRSPYPAALAGLGNVLLDLRRPQESLACYEQAVQADPQFAEAYFGCGNVYLELEHWERALSSFLRALECNPEYAEAFNNLGSTYRALNRLEDAEKAFRNAVRTNSELVAAHNNLGNLYRIQERQELAADAYREVLKRQADMPLAKLRISTLCPTVFSSRAAMDEYLQMATREWNSLRGAYAYKDLGDLLTVANEPPYNLQFFSENIRPQKESYAAIFRYTGPAFTAPPRAGKIRIGSVVTSGHEVAFLRLIWDSLKRMNRDEFEVSIVCSGEAVPKFKHAIQDDTTPIIGLPEQPQRIIQTLQLQRFDVLHYFEICTDARNYFLPFFRLAPVQVTSWGIQVTSGIPNVDYYLSSELVEAPEADEHYSEQLVRARTLLTYQRRLSAPKNGKTRELFGFSASDHLYVCAQHLGKFHPDFDVLLAEILRRDPNGKIVGTEDRYGYGAKRLYERWSRTIPDVVKRIILLPRLSQPDYLSLLAAGDVLLDPLHFGGVSTTYDALSLGQPIVTLPGRQHRSRYTGGCLAKMGVDSCVAQSPEDYVQLAVSLGCDAEKRRRVAEQIRESSWRVFEDDESVREHERIFRELVAQGRVS